jgi:uncharacterized membrane protein YjgN (DUF898 family)
MAPIGEADMAETCPKCGFAGLDSDKCPQCGVLVAMYKVALEKFRLGNTGGASRLMPKANGGRPSVRRTFSFHGRGGTLLGVTIVNVCLTLATLGVYSFWAKVRVRRYLLSQTEVERDRFAYHGTGQELFRGFLTALVVFILPMVLLQLGATLAQDPAVATAAALLTAVVFVVFVPVAMVGARRYRLSRTSWRAVRFGFDGGVRAYLKIFLKGTVFTALTLGLYYPFFHARSHAFMVTHSRFGHRAFRFDGAPRGTFRPFVIAALLFLPTLALSWVWYLAWRRRHYWGHTTFERARFRCTVTGGQLLALLGVNAILLLVTLGLALPWVRVRNARFTLGTLFLEGPIYLAAILRAEPAGSATGDALSGLLGAGFETGV